MKDWFVFLGVNLLFVKSGNFNIDNTPKTINYDVDNTSWPRLYLRYEFFVITL